MLVPSETGVSKDSLLDLGEKDLTIKLEIFFQKKKIFVCICNHEAMGSYQKYNHEAMGSYQKYNRSSFKLIVLRKTRLMFAG